MRRAVPVQFTTGLLLVTQLCSAQPAESPPFTLSYRAPAVCPSENAFRADVASHVHDESRGMGARLELSIEKETSGYRGLLIASDASGAQGSRHIEGSTCPEVAHVLAFLAGLVIELGGRVDTGSPVLPPPPSKSPPPAPRASAPVQLKARPSRGYVSVMLLADARGAFAPIPRMTGEVGVEAGTRGGLWAPSARLVGFIGSSDLEGDAGSATLHFGGGRLELCPIRLGTVALTLRPCIGGELGLVAARAQIAQEPRSDSTLWAAGEATLGLQWLVTRAFFAELGGGPVFPIVRTHYYFEPDRTLYSVPAVSARGSIGFGLLF